MDGEALLFNIFYVIILHFIWLLLNRLYQMLWLKPKSIRTMLQKQGIRGPLPFLIMGNIPEIKRIISIANFGISSKCPNNFLLLDRLFPYLKQWREQFGGTFLFALGGVQLLYVTDLEIIKAISTFRSLDLGKPTYLQKDRGALLGKGLITTSGEVWAHQRKTIAPQLYMSKISGIFKEVVESANMLVRNWEDIIEKEGGIADILVDDYVRRYTAIITSKILFGNSYSKGIKLCMVNRLLLQALASPTVLNGIPFLRYLPTQNNRNIWRLQKEVNSIIMDIMKKHNGNPPRDMLDFIVGGTKNGELGTSTPQQFIVDNCNNIFLAGCEVTAVASAWGLMLLALHPEWQARLRDEVQQVCGGSVPDMNTLGKMRLLDYVVQEVLRLYPVVPFASRQAMQDVKLGDIVVPKDVNIWIWLLELHRDKELWGNDADKFNPERFANGVTGACKFPQAYAPFGFGARVCPGQNLGVIELKVLLALIVYNFTLSISLNFQDTPKYGLLIEPEHGVNLIIRKI